MKKENQLKRQIEIEQAAYQLLKEEGYGKISMLKIAKHAKASNETLYRWYGDKAGLFRALVAKNAEEARLLLEAAIADDADPFKTLEAFGPVLLRILLGPQAIALNQAAAADASGELGQALGKAGRQTIMPILIHVLDKARVQEPRQASELYLDLLVGDMQIRRAIGQLGPPDDDFVAERAEVALQHFKRLIKA